MINFFKNLFKQDPPRPANTGVADIPPSDTDYIAGATSPIPYQERLSDGNWLTYCWSKVKQWCWKNNVYQDNLGCTGNALATSIETQIYQKTGKKIQISRRWINKMSGCNQGSLKGIGNLITAPLDWVRNNGFVLESSYPTPETWTVDEYYAPIPVGKMDELAKEGLENKKLYSFASERVVDMSDASINKHLKHSPLLCTIPGHQTCGVYSPDQYTQYRDSYEPWDKKESAWNFLYLYKFIVTPTSLESGFVKWNNSPEVWFMAKMDTMERLERFKSITDFDPSYFVKEGITTLPAKKPF